jgi:hypothetical protein
LGLLENQGLQVLDATQGVAPQGLELVNTLGEQLGKTGLGTVNPKAELKLSELIGRKLNRVSSFPLCGRGVDAAVYARIQKEQGVWAPLTERHRGQPQQQGG